MKALNEKRKFLGADKNKQNQTSLVKRIDSTLIRKQTNFGNQKINSSFEMTSNINSIFYFICDLITKMLITCWVSGVTYFSLPISGHLNDPIGM